MQSSESVVAQYRSTLRLTGYAWIFGLLPLGTWNMLVSGFRELISGSGSTLSTVVMGLITAEVGLFAAVFWSLGTSAWSYGHTVPSLVMPSSHAMVMAITVVLSVVSICMATRVMKSSTNVLAYSGASTASTASCLVMFGVLVLHEYRCLGLGINDGALLSNMFVLTGLHLGHVLLGALVLQYTAWIVPRIYVVPRAQHLGGGQYALSTEYLTTAGILYMHFVEAAWLGIHGMVYL